MKTTDILVEAISPTDLGSLVSKWNGNDTSNRFHTGVLNRSVSRDFILHWKRNAGSQPVLVGYFRLQIERLISAGYCKAEDKDRVRVNFYHDSDGFIRLRRRAGDGGGITISDGPVP